MLNLKDVVVHYGGIEALQDEVLLPSLVQMALAKALVLDLFPVWCHLLPVKSGLRRIE
jgi:hypothetical protein